jgi:hypothetical protein
MKQLEAIQKQTQSASRFPRVFTFVLVLLGD